MEKLEKLARPTKEKKLVNFRLTESDYIKLRKIAIAKDITMTDFLVEQVEKEIARLKRAGKLSDMVQRE